MAEAEGLLQMNDQGLAASVRTALLGAGTIREVKMFGGIGFMRENLEWHIKPLKLPLRRMRE